MALFKATKDFEEKMMSSKDCLGESSTATYNEQLKVMKEFLQFKDECYEISKEMIEGELLLVYNRNAKNQSKHLNEILKTSENSTSNLQASLPDGVESVAEAEGASAPTTNQGQYVSAQMLSKICQSLAEKDACIKRLEDEKNNVILNNKNLQEQCEKLNQTNQKLQTQLQSQEVEIQRARAEAWLEANNREKEELKNMKLRKASDNLVALCKSLKKECQEQKRNIKIECEQLNKYCKKLEESNSEQHEEIQKARADVWLQKTMLENEASEIRELLRVEKEEQKGKDLLIQKLQFEAWLQDLCFKKYRKEKEELVKETRQLREKIDQLAKFRQLEQSLTEAAAGKSNDNRMCR